MPWNIRRHVNQDNELFAKLFTQYTFIHFTFKLRSICIESDHWQSTLSRHQLGEWNHCHVVTRRLGEAATWQCDSVTKPGPVLVSGQWSRCQVFTLPSGGDCHHSHLTSRVAVTHASADLASRAVNGPFAKFHSARRSPTSLPALSQLRIY